MGAISSHIESEAGSAFHCSWRRPAFRGFWPIFFAQQVGGAIARDFEKPAVERGEFQCFGLLCEDEKDGLGNVLSPVAAADDARAAE